MFYHPKVKLCSSEWELSKVKAITCPSAFKELKFPVKDTNLFLAEHIFKLLQFFLMFLNTSVSFSEFLTVQETELTVHYF